MTSLLLVPPENLDDEDSAGVAMKDFVRLLSWTFNNKRLDANTASAVLAVLRKFPALASETFATFVTKGARYVQSRYLLWMLAEHGADIDTIQAVYKLYPYALHGSNMDRMVVTTTSSWPLCSGLFGTPNKTPGSEAIAPEEELLTICKTRLSRLDVIAFLVNTCPAVGRFQDKTDDAAAKKNVTNRLETAAHWLIENRGRDFVVSSEVDGIGTRAQFYMLLCMFLKANPAVCDGKLFQLALKSGILCESLPDNQKFCNLLCQLVQQNNGFEKFEIKGRNSIKVITLEHAQIIARILPHVKEFHCCPLESFQNLDAFACLMDTVVSLSTSTVNRLEELHLGVPRPIKHNKKNPCHALRRLLSISSNLKFVYLDNHKKTTSYREYNPDTPIFTAIADAMQARKEPLEVFQLDGFRSCEPQALLLILTARCGARCVEIRDCSFLYGNDKQTKKLQAVTQQESTCLEDVTICMSAGKFPIMMIPQLAHIPSLKKFKLECSVMSNHSKRRNVDVTKEVASLLDHDRLEHFSLPHNFCVDFSHISEKLKDNDTLQIFRVSPKQEPKGKSSWYTALADVLATKNTTLTTAIRGDGASWQYYRGPVYYYQVLNKYGRKKVRNPKLSTAEFVAVLNRLMKARGEVEYIYGLLRENPGTWATPACSSTRATMSKVRQPARKKARVTL